MLIAAIRNAAISTRPVKTGRLLTRGEESEGDTAIIYLTGRVRSANTERITQHLRGHGDRYLRVMPLNFASLTYLTSAGFRSLMLARNAAAARGRAFIFAKLDLAAGKLDVAISTDAPGESASVGPALALFRASIAEPCSPFAAAARRNGKSAVRRRAEASGPSPSWLKTMRAPPVAEINVETRTVEIARVLDLIERFAERHAIPANATASFATLTELPYLPHAFLQELLARGFLQGSFQRSLNDRSSATATPFRRRRVDLRVRRAASLRRRGDSKKRRRALARSPFFLFDRSAARARIEFTR